MPIYSLDALVTPSIREAIQQQKKGLLEFYDRNTRPSWAMQSIVYSLCVPDGFPSSVGGSWEGGRFAMSWGYWEPHNASFRWRDIMYCSIINHTNNCGVRAIQGLKRRILGAEVLFFDLLESYLYWLNYSAIVGSTGTQTGKPQIEILNIVNASRPPNNQWTITHIGPNRRVDSQLSLFRKYLTTPTIQIDWVNPTPNEQPTATT